jgi:hypothetical protein
MKSDSLSTSVHQKFSRFSVGRKLIGQSGFLSPRLLMALLCCLGAYVISARTLPAFFQGDAPTKVWRRTLSFAERVAYQRAIDDAYWRHRIWPKEHPDPKPPLDAVLSQAQLEEKVADYLRESQALVDQGQRPITVEQLQSEMDRMAKHTKQPEVLREIFEALGNDPFAIAECLAKPVLTERFVADLSAHDKKGRFGLRPQKRCVACRSQQRLQTCPTLFQGLPKEMRHAPMIPGQPPAPPTHRLAEHTTSQCGLAPK